MSAADSPPAPLDDVPKPAARYYFSDIAGAVRTVRDGFRDEAKEQTAPDPAAFKRLEAVGRLLGVLYALERRLRRSAIYVKPRSRRRHARRG
jgi:hypothetical protein